jgi:hypothetical protein
MLIHIGSWWLNQKRMQLFWSIYCLFFKSKVYMYVVKTNWEPTCQTTFIFPTFPKYHCLQSRLPRGPKSHPASSKFTSRLAQILSRLRIQVRIYLPVPTTHDSAAAARLLVPNPSIQLQLVSSILLLRPVYLCSSPRGAAVDWRGLGGAPLIGCSPLLLTSSCCRRLERAGRSRAPPPAMICEGKELRPPPATIGWSVGVLQVGAVPLPLLRLVWLCLWCSFLLCAPFILF